ncbi:MAG: hypothetical protein ACRDL1_04235 [Solirubrobacterales bacterium]
MLGALLLVPPASEAAGPSPFFGVVAQGEPSEADFEVMAQGGVGTYRWLISWPSLQPSANAQPDWKATDQLVANLADHDIEPLPFVYGSPCFVVDCERTPRSEAHRRPPLGTSHARLAWTRFLAALVDRYGSGGSFWSANRSLPYRPITAWEVWNEENTPRFYRPSPSPAGYAELLRISAGTIRSHDRNARILLGGMAGEPRGQGAVDAPRFLDVLYGIPGAKRYFDGVAVHPYARDVAGVERQILGLRRVQEAHRDAETPIWVTELGWGTSDTGKGRLVATVEGQARMLDEAFRLLLGRRGEWNVARVLWYSWRDAPGICGWCGSSGLLEADGSARPAWASFAELSGGTPATPSGGDGGRSVPLAAIAVALAIAAVAGASLLVRRSREL